mmetsp:Transcript_41540/g.115531  ORF Transcript_41540/g.115531 Transcript_41540/m.115531 type:complete len:215 (-) Transcript_41540:353-997(-)
MERGVVLVGDRVGLRPSQEEEVFQAVGGRTHCKVQCDAIVPAPDQLLGLPLALDVGHVQDPQAVIHGQDLEDALGAQACQQPAAEGHRKGHVGPLVHVQVACFVAVHAQHGPLCGADDHLDVGRSLVGWRQHTEAEGLGGDPQVRTPVAGIARVCQGSVDEKAESLRKQCYTTRPERREHGLPLVFDAVIHCEDMQRLAPHCESPDDASLEDAH